MCVCVCTRSLVCNHVKSLSLLSIPILSSIKTISSTPPVKHPMEKKPSYLPELPSPHLVYVARNLKIIPSMWPTFRLPRTKYDKKGPISLLTEYFPVPVFPRLVSKRRWYLWSGQVDQADRFRHGPPLGGMEGCTGN